LIDVLIGEKPLPAGELKFLSGLSFFLDFSLATVCLPADQVSVFQCFFSDAFAAFFLLVGWLKFC